MSSWKASFRCRRTDRKCSGFHWYDKPIVSLTNSAGCIVPEQLHRNGCPMRAIFVPNRVRQPAVVWGLLNPIPPPPLNVFLLKLAAFGVVCWKLGSATCGHFGCWTLFVSLNYLRLKLATFARCCWKNGFGNLGMIWVAEPDWCESRQNWARLIGCCTNWRKLRALKIGHKKKQPKSKHTTTNRVNQLNSLKWIKLKSNQIQVKSKSIKILLRLKWIEFKWNQNQNRIKIKNNSKWIKCYCN